jgi:bifunctional ADP-heptose synthase (sugar kinase/adenylyltransferase)|tara:strand:- start:631 stop:1389 length:759 start_codon:yes stop_codon:yes gene_type:complete
MKVLVIGESCIDNFTYGEANRLTPEAPVPVFNSFENIIVEGMAMNVRNNIKSLGVEVGIHTNPNWRIVEKTRFIDHRTNHMFLRVDQNDHKISHTTNLRKIKFDQYDGVVISDYNKGFLTEEDIYYISENHDLVFLDTKKVLGDYCNNVEFIKINNSEYLKSENYAFANKNIRDKLIVTLGSKGCMYKEHVFPVVKTEVKDVAGAGDTFIAGFTVKYLQTKDIVQSIQFANECATIVVQKRGVSVVGQDSVY